ncbi:hypothetical protein [Aestuariivirga sp.]|uniref:hypothetical protein n=1 Tax=Aestuariivirga sp. TaxID=2650926 RepID=UPI003BA9E1B1
MTVLVQELRIILSDDCGVEEAETLLTALLEEPGRVVQMEAGKLHTALWQVLLAVRPQIQGRTGDAFADLHILPLINGGNISTYKPADRRLEKDEAQ